MNAELRTLLVEGAAGLGLSLDEEAVQRFSNYLDLLQTWGRKINLTARLDDREIIIYHFLDSLAAAPILAAGPAIRLIDLGAGAGFPALPLKFVLPDLSVVLVDSVRKKIAFCQEVLRSANLAGVDAVWGRGEELGTLPEHRGTYRCAVSRALGQSADVAKLALPFLAPGGRILLYKGEPGADEMKSLEAFCKRNRATLHSHPVKIPFLDGARTLLVIDLSAEIA